MKPTSTKPAGFLCDRCSLCCRSHRVPLTLADLLRLQAGPLPPEEFTEFLGPDEVEMSGEPESFARLKEGRRVLVLRHSNSTDGCVFLNARGCGVHELRPSSCRTYPYDRPEKNAVLGLVPGAMCPTETGVLLTLGRSGDATIREEFSAAVQKRDEELKEHTEWIQRWNSRQRTRIRLGRVPQSGAEFLAELVRDSGDTT